MFGSAGLALTALAGMLVSGEMFAMAVEDLREDFKDRKNKKKLKFKGHEDSPFNDEPVESNADEKYETEENIDDVKDEQ